MYLVVGLGNPGQEYSETRHNVGFLAIDAIAGELGVPSFKAKFDSEYSEKKLETGQNIILQKPQTYMNRSGDAVSKLLAYYKVKPENMYVIHDDIDLASLAIKLKFSGGSGGHNGIRSIDSAVGTQYWRIRIGVGRPMLREQVSYYVLSKFAAEMLSALNQNVLKVLAEHITELVLSPDKQSVVNNISEAIESPC
jgi:PTH1 family peptidyl-tRNA hydrolase